MNDFKLITSVEVRRMRRRLGVTTGRMAELLGCSHTTIDRLQNGYRTPSRMQTLALRYLEMQMLGGPEK